MFLLVQAGCGDNLVWSSLVLKIAHPDQTLSPADVPPEVAAEARRVLFRLLDDKFLELAPAENLIRPGGSRCTGGREP